MSTVPIVRVEHLVKRYQESGRAALNDVSFEVAEGAFFALLGPNGAGKTTAISVLVTTLAKTSGFVSVGGVELDRDPRGIRSQIGVVFQSPSLDEELSGEQNVRIEACLYGMYAYRPLLALMPRTYLERVHELASVFGLDEVITRPVRTYSGGMRRKLEIVRCLIHRPRVLFLDEPTTGLDPESRHAFWDYVHRARREHGITVVLTTHYLAEAEAADAVCVIDRGTVSISGSPDALKRGLVDRYVEVDADDRGALQAALSGHGHTVEGSGPFRVRFDCPTAQPLLEQIDIPLTMLRIHEPTLEEAYLELIARNAASEYAA